MFLILNFHTINTIMHFWIEKEINETIHYLKPYSAFLSP